MKQITRPGIEDPDQITAKQGSMAKSIVSCEGERERAEKRRGTHKGGEKEALTFTARGRGRLLIGGRKRTLLSEVSEIWSASHAATRFLTE